MGLLESPECLDGYAECERDASARLLTSACPNRRRRLQAQALGPADGHDVPFRCEEGLLCGRDYDTKSSSRREHICSWQVRVGISCLPGSCLSTLISLRHCTSAMTPLYACSIDATSSSLLSSTMRVAVYGASAGIQPIPISSSWRACTTASRLSPQKTAFRAV